MLLQTGERLSIKSTLRASVQIRNPSSVFGRVEVLLQLLETGESDAGAEVTGVFAFGVFDVFRSVELGQRWERWVVISDDGGRDSLFPLG